jgi:hypothetical protein
MKQNTEGTRSLYVKQEGKQHIPGHMEMADRNAIKSLFSIATPLFKAGGENVKVIVTPLMQYLKFGCCEDIKHISNRTDSDYIGRETGRV